MSNPFTNFLSGVVSGVLDNSSDLKDYQHASRMYVDNTYARAPKVGFLYFVSFEINRAAVKDQAWASNGMNSAGLLVKRLDLPKFSITTETANQYNRKTVVQTLMKYSPVTIDFHDDNSDITNNLWKNYYRYYFADTDNTKAFGDTKYGTTDYAYGLNNNQNKGSFFKQINFYIMHQGKFTEISLINPLVTDWSHDSLDQSEGTRTLTNKMSIAYESVIYKEGKISKNGESGAFTAQYYDNTPSPLRVAGNGSVFGAGGVVSGISDVFGSLSGDNPNYLGALIQGANVVKSVSQLNKAGLAQEGYSILKGVLGDISKTGNQPGAIGDSIRSNINNGIGVGVKLFQNSSVNGTTTAAPSNTTGAQ